ncbi:MAG: hypothetical protein JWN08_1757 [Frankiales bacterium]|nr:hypothetical protein [Frankiales bacterium]
MEFGEALLRLRTWLVPVVLCVLLPALIVLGLSAGRPTDYAASVRITTSDTVNKSNVEAEARVSTVRALATTPSIVARSLAAVDVDRDAQKVAAQDVTVELLGVSTVATIQVTDHDPRSAVLVANGLADTLVAHLTGLSCDRGAVLQALDAAIDRRKEDRIAVETRLATLAADNPLASSLRALDEDLSAQLARLEVERLDAASRTCGAGVSVLDRSSRAPAVPSTLPHDLVLAGLLGLGLAGSGLAAWELARPSVGGPLQLARLLRAPVLGVVGRRASGSERRRRQALVVSVCLAARKHGSERVLLVGGRRPGDLAHVLEALRSADLLGVSQQETSQRPEPHPRKAPPGKTVVRIRSKVASGAAHPVVMPAPAASAVQDEAPYAPPAAAPPPSADALPVPVFAVADPAALLASDWATDRTSVLVVAASGQSRSSLRTVEDLVALSGWPVLGGVLVRSRWSR